MPTLSGYSYFITPRYGPLLDDQPQLFDDPFHVDLRVSYITPRDQPGLPINTITKKAPLPHGLLKSHDTAKPAMKPFLSFLATTGIEVDDQIVKDVSAFARALRLLPICRGSHGLVVPGIKLQIWLDP